MVSVIILSVTGKCNLKCVGCYAERREHDIDMIKVIKGLDLLLRKYDIREVIFHGGEPLMIGKEKFESIAKYIKKVRPNIKLGVQTNATLIDEEWIDIFKKYCISVGVSYKGYKELYEKLTGGGDYYRYLNGISMLREYGLLGGTIFHFSIKFEDIVYDNIEKIIDDIVNIGFTSVDIHESMEPGKIEKYADINIKAQEYIFDKGYSLRIKNLFMIYGCISKSVNVPKGCIWRHDCYKFMCLTGEGEMYWCNRRLKSYKVLYDECLTCPIFGLCEGGCEAIREINGGKFPYCEDRIKMYKYVVENLNKFHLHYGFLR